MSLSHSKSRIERTNVALWRTNGVTMALGFPLGPLALGDRLGPRVVVEILQSLWRTSGDPRNRDFAGAHVSSDGVQEELLASKKKEVEGINAKYDDDKARYNSAIAAKNNPKK